MAFHDRAWMTISAVNNGSSPTFTLGTNVGAYQTFAGDGVVDQEALPSYTAIEGNSWEVGSSVYTASGTTMTRVVRKSSNNNNPVAFTTAATVFLDATAADLAKFALNTDTRNIATTASIGAGTTTPFTALHSFKSILGGAPATSGTVDANTIARLQGGTVGLDIGVLNSGTTWIQPRVVSDFTNNLPLSLCPNGGAVNVGAALVAGTTVGAASQVAAGAGTNGTCAIFTGNGSATGYVAFHNANQAARWGYIGYATTGSTGNGSAISYVNEQGGGHSFAGTGIFVNTDNTQDIALGSYRIRNFYLAGSVLTSSDGELKVLREGDMTPAEREWARTIKVVAGQTKDAVTKKGADKARMHWWVVAQQVYEAGIAAGIADPYHYSFLGCDPLEEDQTSKVKVLRQAMETVEEQQPSFEIVDGQAVMTVVTKKVDRPAYDLMPIVDADGNPVMVTVADEQPAVDEVRGDDGEVLVPASEPQAAIVVQATHPVPRMEEIEEEHTIRVAVLDDKGQPIMRRNVNYAELSMFFEAARQAS